MLGAALLGAPATARGIEARAAGAARQAQDEVVVDLRVTASLGDRRATVDRGSADGLEVGDAIWLTPREGGRYRASVVEVDERSAVIELSLADFVPSPGTRGQAILPGERFGAPEPAPVDEDPEPEAEAVEPVDDGDSSDWSYEDDGFSQDMPLLAGARAVRPADRRASFTGRYYVAADATATSDEGRSESFLRSGGRLTFDNVFGRGGTLDIGGEWDRRQFNRPELDDITYSQLRVERLSYALGGTRFEGDRMQVGRFLQTGAPEFGVVDGFEWSRRLDGSHSFGVSTGFMPEPDQDYESGHDFEIAGWYRWVSDPTELASAQIGYQKTWHDGAVDRDLVVAKGHYLPRRGWTTFGTLWIDLYTSSDEAKGSGAEVTQALLTSSPYTGRSWGLDLTYAHQRYPELDRNELLPPVLATQLADERIHRLGGDFWVAMPVKSRLVGRLGVWEDADDEGGDAELGVELEGLMGPGTRVRVLVFGSAGEFTDVTGSRTSLGVSGESLSFDLFYELANYDQVGFDENNDDFVQHRLRTSVAWRAGGGVTVSGYLDGTIFNTERGLTAGVFAQWSF
ncbi:hypothetical protein Pla86_35140 [Planctomycetes bacterium Pla86]|uniref:Uncharacterized protein n=2 Tax=Engelhardtia mirabilis TaxID=2528011 RepID=A0A518BN61_9BACT|nr:hypothetical protein Pla133_35160 [Planctomycetes bacterium Pla133]QDV02744.1 hypothetical protein Pla86_35140 [Planctomycetes bacterium Pla86]